MTIFQRPATMRLDSQQDRVVLYRSTSAIMYCVVTETDEVVKARYMNFLMLNFNGICPH
jgi:hypothetical protein